MFAVCLLCACWYVLCFFFFCALCSTALWQAAQPMPTFDHTVESKSSRLMHHGNDSNTNKNSITSHGFNITNFNIANFNITNNNKLRLTMHMHNQQSLLQWLIQSEENYVHDLNMLNWLKQQMVEREQEVRRSSNFGCLIGLLAGWLVGCSDISVAWMKITHHHSKHHFKKNTHTFYYEVWTCWNHDWCYFSKHWANLPSSYSFEWLVSW